MCSFLLGKCKFEICYIRSDFTFLLISMNNHSSSLFLKEVVYLFYFKKIEVAGKFYSQKQISSLGKKKTQHFVQIDPLFAD